MSMMKNCPRSNGYLVSKGDLHGLYHNCLQCGYYLDSYDSEVLESQRNVDINHPHRRVRGLPKAIGE